MSTIQPNQDGERFGADTYVAGQGDLDQPKKKGWFGTCLIGCLVIGLIMVVLCGIGGFVAYKQAPAMARTMVQPGMDESELPAEEKEAIMEQYDRVSDAFVAGDIGWEELAVLMEDLGQSPVMTSIILFGIEKKYLDQSGLSDEEREEAEQTLTRIMTGVMQDELTNDELQELLNPVLSGSDQPKLKDKLSDEELREFFAAAKALVDEKEIPFEESTANISDKIKEIVDDHLGESGGGEMVDDLNIDIQVEDAEAEPVAVP